MNVELKLNPEKGGIEVCAYKNIVETVEDPEKEISLEEAREIKKSYKVGGTEWLRKSLPRSLAESPLRLQSRSLCRR